MSRSSKGASAGVGGEAELSAALRELKECTSVTMETVGIRCMKRVNTSVYKKGLAQLKGAAFSQFRGNKSDHDHEPCTISLHSFY